MNIEKSIKIKNLSKIREIFLGFCRIQTQSKVKIIGCVKFNLAHFKTISYYCLQTINYWKRHDR